MTLRASPGKLEHEPARLRSPRRGKARRHAAGFVERAQEIERTNSAPRRRAASRSSRASVRDAPRRSWGEGGRELPRGAIDIVRG